MFKHHEIQFKPLPSQSDLWDALEKHSAVSGINFKGYWSMKFIVVQKALYIWWVTHSPTQFHLKYNMCYAVDAFIQIALE